MPLVCEILPSVHLSGSTFTHHGLNISPISEPHLDIKWNREHCQKGKKQAEILILDNVKMLKFKIFPRLCP